MNKYSQNNKVFKKITYENVITLFFLCILVITLILNMIFQGGSKLPRIILNAVTVIVFWAFFRFTFLKKSKASYIATLIFIIMSMYFGNVLDFYSIVPYYDKILHTASGIIIGLMSIVIYVHFTNEYFQKINSNFMILFCILLTLALAGGWEIWEYGTDKIFGLMSQKNSLDDSMTDIICGTVGGILSLIPIYRFSKGHKNKFLQFIINEIISDDYIM
ncbi:MAG: DUF2238 domain-containing protein [Clostridium butyricum]|nr:DUF2238 domain-containing protein [Clostridium butyricum]